LVSRFHEEHPLEPGMPLEALRAAVRGRAGADVPAAVVDLVLDWASRKQAIEVVASSARRPGWSASVDGGATERLLGQLETSQWRIPTVAELEQSLPGVPVQGLLVHLTRSGGVEQVDRERFTVPRTLETFRIALEASLAELGSATPSQLRDRLGLTRKYLIPLLEWADRKGITSRQGDARQAARLTAPSSGS
jgi:selenocysteine-specific elongation factor